MLRLSKLADYAIFILVKLGRMDGLTTASSLAVETGIPEPTVAKLLKTLAAHKIVRSSRGARGGYSLINDLGDVSVASVIMAVDGPVMVTACCDGNSCLHEEKCGLSVQWDRINDSLKEVLEKVSLADMGDPQFVRLPPACCGGGTTVKAVL
ncbi:SUF system Fe-S cluster assembly regulator [Acetobacteraceae bacterium ESL0709]|nr:SUF system Fe-S cluster assembly regulator [Acetobacteraceae bacterium ESL0697]MDF7678326.1 SUF system Fe-S cluster assembly regulator [Acetobacteraceae bacterium ESL0709]